MRTFRPLLTTAAIILAGLMAGTVSEASSVTGLLTAVGVFEEDRSPQIVSARARVRITGTCDTTPVQDLYIILRSGRLDDVFAELNSLHMRNAYTTLLAALLSGSTIEIQGLPNCSPNDRGEIFLDLWTGNVSIIH